MDKDRLLKETIVLLSADLYQTFYDSDECGGWDEAVTKIISLAEQFEKELDWQDGDEDYAYWIVKDKHGYMHEINICKDEKGNFLMEGKDYVWFEYDGFEDGILADIEEDIEFKTV